MIRLLNLHLILGIICLKLQEINANDRDVSPAVLCRNPQVVSATQTPYGVICLIPKAVESAPIEKRQQFVRSLPKLRKAEQNENLQAKFIPNFKLIQSQFMPQSNVLTKRSIFSNWLQKFYESLYKTLYKSLKNSMFGNINIQSEQQQQQLQHQQQQQSLPQESTGHLPLVHPDQLRPEGQTLIPAQHPNHSPFATQESQFITNFVPGMGQKPEQLLTSDFSQSLIPSTSDMDMNGDSLPLLAYNNEDVQDNEPVIDETRLGPAVHDLPQYNYGSVRQLATYLQSIQSKINRQKFKNFEDDKQSEGSEFINDYSSLSADSSNDKHEFVIPLYTDVKVKDKQFDSSEGRSSEEVRRPRKLVYEFHGYKRDMDCKGKFKPLKSETEKEKPKIESSVRSSTKSRRKRYIELDYSQMQLRKLPIWFKNDEEGPVPEAIIEVKPRSLFRWEQPMLGWKPIVPPEELRKDLFLKRNGGPLENWDHEQVESQTSYLWFKPDLNSNQTNDKTENNTPELNGADTLTIESLRNLDLSKSSVIIDRRSPRSQGYTPGDYYEAKEQHIYDKTDNNKYVLPNDKPIDNQVVGLDSRLPVKEGDVNRGIKAVEVENVGEDITQIKSLEEIAAIPGAIIKPIDQKLTEILLKVLSHNSDFAQKRITNAYFLEFPKLPKYTPSTVQKPALNQMIEDQIYRQIQIPVQTQVEMSVAPNYDLDYDKDIQLTDSDYEYGEMVCANRINGAVADARKGCRIYFLCTPYTIDTYVCPRGSIFDDRKQFCLPSNQVICGTNS